MDSNFFKQIKRTIAIIDYSFYTNFLPVSRKLIEDDLIQKRLFEASDKFKAGDHSNDALFVHLKAFGELGDPCYWFLFKSFHPSEIEPGAELTMTRMYELMIELISPMPEYIIRCHWSLHLPKESNKIDYALCYQWILRLNDDRTAVEGKLNYFEGDPVDTASTYELAEVV